jgi:hypothetical protein
MLGNRSLFRIAAIGLAFMAHPFAQQAPMGPRHDSGQSVTGAFEGWFRNQDGSFSLLFGYYNRNLKQELDIPIGTANRIEPGGPDLGQPTHFLTGRNWGVFTVSVPKDFGSAKLVWSIAANGVTTQVPASLSELWEVAPFRDANGNAAPWIGFQESGPFINGPRPQSESLTAAVGKPVDLPLWVADDASVIPGASRPNTPPVTLYWSKFRGPGQVVIANARPNAQTVEFTAPKETVFRGKAVTTATFAAPGEYVLRVVANDWSGDGSRGFQCCWSNAEVAVTVK